MQCPICKGRGQVEVMSPADNMEFYQQTCIECDGTGDIPGKRILSYDIETIPNYLATGKPLRPGWYKAKVTGKMTYKGEITVLKTSQLKENKFYIGSNSIINRGTKGWGHPTVEEAVEHAQQLLSGQEAATECFIVEIVKVVRRKPINVTVEDV